MISLSYTDTLHGFVECARIHYPSEPLLESACMFTKHVQELLVYASQTCPNSPKPSEKLVVVTPINKDKRVRFFEPVTSFNNIPKQTDSLKTIDFNKPLLTSTGVKPTTSASGSKPSGNTKNNRITRPPCSNQKNKVEDYPSKVKSSLNKTNSISKPINNALVKHSVRNAMFESICSICNKCLFDANHDMCLIDFVNDVNVRSKSKSNRNKMRIAWRPTGKVFTDVAYKWKPTRRIFTIVGNSCPLTRITPKKIVHLKETTSKSVETPKLEIKVYSRRPKQIKSVVQIVLWYLDSGCSKHMIGNRSQLMNLVSKFLGTVRFGNDQVAKIMGYGDYQQGNLAKDGLARGIPKLKFQKDHMCSACALEKSKKSSHQPKAEDTNQEKLYLLHMDLCGPMRVESIYGKKYILNGVVKRQNQTLVEATRTMLIFSKAPLFLWAEAINTTCYTQNRSLIRLRYNKTSYELMHDKKPDLSLFHVFGSLCYPTNDSKDLGKLNAKANIGIFVGYAPAKKAFRIYNRRTQKIMETIHLTFDELTTMASEQFGSVPEFQVMTPTTSCSGLVPNIIPQKPCNPPKRDDWDTLFQPLFDEYFNPPTIDVSTVLVAAAPRAVDIANSPVSTSIDQDAPSSSIPSTQEHKHSLIISQGVKDSPKTPLFHNDRLHEFLHEDSTSQGLSSNVRPYHTPFELIGRWTKDHPITNVIGDPSRSVSTRKQLKTNAMWCYFDAFLTSVEPKNFKQAITEPSWIDAMQE
ncbi:integrase, catalytic region, zinc finger, CCHC-type containing protein [Tanacetum coccineum]